MASEKVTLRWEASGRLPSGWKRSTSSFSLAGTAMGAIFFGGGKASLIVVPGRGGGRVEGGKENFVSLAPGFFFPSRLSTAAVSFSPSGVAFAGFPASSGAALTPPSDSPSSSPSGFFFSSFWTVFPAAASSPRRQRIARLAQMQSREMVFNDPGRARRPFSSFNMLLQFLCQV